MKAILLGIAYVHLLTITENPVLTAIGTSLRIPIWAFAILYALTLTPQKMENKFIPKSFRFYIAFLTLFLIWGSSSLLWSVDRADTLIKAVNFTLITVFLYLIFTRRWIRSYDYALDDLKVLTIAASSFIVISALFTVPEIIESMSGSVRYQGIFHNPNTIAALTAVFFFPSVLVYRHNNQRTLLLMPGLFIVALFLSGSRSSTLALILAGFVVLVLRVLMNLGYLNRLIPIISFLACTGAIAYLWLLATNRVEATSDISSIMPRQLNMEVSSTLFNGREELWSTGLALFSENPIQGYGFNGTRTALKNYRDNGLYLGEGTQLHNSYAEILVDLGAVGAGIFLAILSVLILKVVQNVKTAPLLSASVLSPLFLANSESALFGLSSLVAVMFWTVCILLFVPPENKAKKQIQDKAILPSPARIKPGPVGSAHL